MYIDTKVVVWNRVKIQCNEEDLLETENRVAELLKSGDSPEQIIESLGLECEYETLYDTETLISPEHSGGRPTIEFYGDNGAKVYCNKVKP